MGAIGDAMDSIRSIDLRLVTMQAISLGMMVSSVMILWKTLMCITSSESPIVVVLSGSMEPGFQKGDILFLHMSKAPIRAGEIVVFHVEVHERHDTKAVDVVTKGDDNDVDDDEGGIYADDQQWLQQQDVAGRIVGFLPYVGWVTIIMTENPIIKYILIGALGLLVIASKE
jgi:signal peptidase